MPLRKIKAMVKLAKLFEKEGKLSRRQIEKLLDVSPSTAHQYIDELREQFNAPIAYNSKRNFYYCTQPWNLMEEIEVEEIEE